MSTIDLKKCFSICLGVLLFSITSSSAQNSDIRFHHLSIDKGLSQSSVNVILQDRYGFMWFGTQDGLNRFDGYEFVVYKHDPADYSSLSDNFIHTIYEDSRGNIWIGTDWGLNLFNRKDETFMRFKHNPAGNNSISSNSVLCISEDKKGNLLVGTFDGGINEVNIDTIVDKITPRFLSFKKNTAITKELKSNNIRCMITDSNNVIWIGTGSHGLVRWDKEKSNFTSYQFACFNEESIDVSSVWCILEDKNKNLWVGTSQGLALFDRKKESYNYIAWTGSSGSTRSGVHSLFGDDYGNLWIGTDGYGLIKYHLIDKQFTFYHNRTYLPGGISSNTVNAILSDKTGSLWVGTENGINKFDFTNQNFRHYLHLDNNPYSLSNNVVWSIFKAAPNELYVCTDKGLDLMDSTFRVINHFTKGDRQQNSIELNRLSYVMRDKSGKLWLAAEEGLFFLNQNGKRIEKLRLNDKNSNNLNNRKIYSIFEDSRKNLWLSTKDGLLILNAAREKMYLHRSGSSNSSLGSNNIRTVFEDRKGRIWLGTQGGGLERVVFNYKNTSDLNLITFMHLKIQENKPFSLNNNVVLSICEDNFEKDVLWLGTFGGGLNKFNIETGRFTHYTEKEGLANNVIYGILQDSNGNLWMSTNNGLSCFFKKGEQFKNYRAADGLQSNEFNTGAYFKAKNGDMFFGGINGFNVFKPENIRNNPFPPRVVITGLTILNNSKDNIETINYKSVYEKKEIHLSYKDRFFNIQYAGLHFTYPEENNYKYMLVGYDENWINAKHRREAYYSNLEPGRYDFKVLASNSDGVWGTEPTVITIYVSPPFYKTWLFRFLIVALSFATLIVFINYRLRFINDQKKDLEKQIEARTREILAQKVKLESQNLIIEEEKNKVEKLLLNILPQETVDELKTKGKATARSYRMASVMFTDFRGFTKIAEGLNPQELIAELDKHFIKFDEIIEKHGLEKIKTIGDAYMCCGGLPIRNKSNPVDIVLAGLEIQRYIEELKLRKMAREEKYWDLRIGIHTGELIAGVVGIKRFAYDVWGDTVNIAARMESSGEIGKVNISGKTFQTAKEFFICTYRGKVKAKNKGEIDMYFVHSIRPELSVNGEGIEPNEDFYHRLDHILYSNINYKNAEQHIITLLSENLPDGLFYHGLHHTLDVCRAAEEIATHEGVAGEDLYLLKTAALFHDAGFTQQYEKNEPIGVALAKQTLPQFGYSTKQIEAIEKIIISTQIPQSPNTLLERIMCDADLDYLGRDDFHEIADNLKRELMAFGKISSDKAWDQIQVPFLEKHGYFTDYSKRMRSENKLKRIEEIKQRLIEDRY